MKELEASTVEPQNTEAVNPKTVNPQDVDVLVVGGGPAGSSTAVIAAQAGLKVLLVDRGCPFEPSTDISSPPAYKIGEGLPGAGRMLLGRLGVWGEFRHQDHLPSYSNRSFWGSDDCHMVDFIRDPHGHAWHLNRLAFDDLLRRRAVEVGAELWMGTKMMDLRHLPDSSHLQESDAAWSVRLRRNEPDEAKNEKAWSEVRARLVVDASGRVSRVAHHLGITRHRDDKLVGSHRLFRQEEGAEPDRDTSTFVESVAEGWWYTAPLPGGVRVVAFFTDGDLESCGQGARDVGFQDLLARTGHLKDLITAAKYRPITEPQAAPSFSGALEEFVGTDWLAVGDAATCFDPLSSQGIYSAIHHGIVAGEALVRHLKTSETGQDSLQDYRECVLRVYQTYLRNRGIYYASEQRFNHHEFWRRRATST